jgi:hypothetical protein
MIAPDFARRRGAQANPDGKGPTLTAGIDGTGEPILEHPKVRTPARRRLHELVREACL